MEEREKQRKRPVVALVEDDAAIATMYQYALESAGFDVTVYGDPDTFLDGLRTIYRTSWCWTGSSRASSSAVTSFKRCVAKPELQDCQSSS